MVEFTKQELNEMETLEIYGGTTNSTPPNNKCQGKEGIYYACVNNDYKHKSCTHTDCSNTRCTHDKCISLKSTLNPGIVGKDCSIPLPQEIC